MLDTSRFWDESVTSTPAATKAEIEQWEAQHRVKLPKLLRKVYRQHNGGTVRTTEMSLLPLSQMLTPDEDFWDDAMLDESDVEDGCFEDRSRVLVLGWGNEIGGQYFLNYNDQDNDEPSVWSYFSDPGDMNREAKSVTRYFKPLLATSDKPVVDWNETHAGTRLAEETIDEAYWLAPGSQTKFVLVQHEEHLTFFEHRVVLGDEEDQEESLDKMVLPLPLDGDAMSIERRHQDGTGPWGIHLEPAESDGIVFWESRRISDAEWKNTRSKGAPIYVILESESEERLKTLRVLLIGAEAAAERAEDDRIERDVTQKLESMSDDEAQLASFQILQSMRAAMPQLEGSTEVPPEVEEAAKKMSEMMDKMQQEMKAKFGDAPISPDVVEMIDSLTRKLRKP